MKNINKSLSLVLAFVLLLSVFSFNVVYAVEENTASTQTQQTEEFVLPDIVPEAESAERGYIGRSKTEEKDNYTFVFKNSDNTRTMRVYSHPVKYTDDDGNIKDITLDIQSRAGGGFETKDNSIKTTFGAKLSDGIRLQHENVDIKLIPANKNITPVLSEDNQTVSYTLDEKTSLEYSLTYTGFKEDIVVSEYTGQTEYEFLLYTNGLTVKEEMGSFYLADSEGNRKANIGDIIIFTADERNNTLGSLSCIEIKENQIYGLTIHVDAEYLKDEKTVYPIRIDPTFEITSATTEGAIEDVTVYTGTEYYSGTSGILYLGTSNNLTYRILMKFPNLDLTGITAAQITNATVEFRDVMCQSVQVAMECRYYTGGETDWSESIATYWAMVGGDSYIGNLIDTKTIYYGNGNEGSDINRYSFNITNAAKSWANGTHSPQKGFIFKAADESFSSTEDRLKYFGSYNRSDYRTSFTLQYTETIDVSVQSTYLLVGGTKQVTCSTNPSGLSVSWSSNNTAIATVNNAGLVTGISEGTVKITATYTDTATGSTKSDYVYLYVKDSLGIKDNTKYYIMNYNSGRYLALETASDTNMTNVYTRPRGVSNLSQWITEKQSDGAYQLISVYSATGKALDVSGTNIDIYTDNNASYQKFTIYRINSGTYQGLYYIRYGNYYVAQNSNYNVYLTTSLSSSAVWSFMAVDKRDATIYSFKYSGYDSTANNAIFDTTFEALGYEAFEDLINKTAEDAYSDLCSWSDIFVFRGHGNPGLIGFRDSNGSTTSRIYANSCLGTSSSNRYIDSFDKNQLSLLRVVMYLGCNTGVDRTYNGNTYNLVDSTYQKGAHFVLGTSQTVYPPDSDAFLKGFLEALNDNSNVIGCIQAGIESAGNNVLYEDDSRGQYPIVYAGDTIQYLNY